jgi:hypothetical protein
MQHAVLCIIHKRAPSAEFVPMGVCMTESVWIIVPKTPAGQPIPVTQFPFIIGRDPASDYVVDHPSVSGFHVQCNANGKNLLLHALDHDSVKLRGNPIKRVLLKARKGVSFALTISDDVSFLICYGALDDVTPESEDESESGPWFFWANGREHGPLTVDELFDAVDSGKLTPEHVVWRGVNGRRVPAYEVEGLFDDASSSQLFSRPDASGNIDIKDRAITCPYCWHQFQSDEVLAIAAHPELQGDSVLGTDEQKRFLPSRLTPDGLALDEEGLVCTDMACPKCHMRLPAAVFDHKPYFLSLVGATGSGKSYFLASMTWTMRTTLPRQFALRFMDVDALTNRWINDYEEKIFLQSDDSQIQAIAKTDQRLPIVYREVQINGMGVNLPLPCMFSLQSSRTAEQTSDFTQQRCLILYDNAGEHYQAGEDKPEEPGTQHLIRAEGIIFLFDPTEDARMRRFISSRGINLHRSDTVRRQDTLLVEMISRIRRHSGLGAGASYTKPLVIGLSKSDVFGDFFDLANPPLRWDPARRVNVLDVARIMEISYQARDLLDFHAPEVVAAAESFAKHVVYIPNTALGHIPGENGVVPRDVNPQWADVPVLYMLAQSGIVQTAGCPPQGTQKPPEVCESDSDNFYVRLAPGSRRLKVPHAYAGFTLRCPDTGRPFQLPQLDQSSGEVL